MPLDVVFVVYHAAAERFLVSLSLEDFLLDGSGLLFIKFVTIHNVNFTA